MSMGGNSERGQPRQRSRCRPPVWSTGARHGYPHKPDCGLPDSHFVWLHLLPMAGGWQTVTAFAAGMSPVMSCFTVICEQGNFAGICPMMSRASVIHERDSFAGICPVAGTGQQAGIRSS